MSAPESFAELTDRLRRERETRGVPPKDGTPASQKRQLTPRRR